MSIFIFFYVEIDNIWYEGSKLCVDLSENMRPRLDAGSAAGASFYECVVRTFATYPNVETIEILLGGKKGESGNHFSFVSVFEVKR